jgi:hypothetical protein
MKNLFIRVSASNSNHCLDAEFFMIERTPDIIEGVERQVKAFKDLDDNGAGMSGKNLGWVKSLDFWTWFPVLGIDADESIEIGEAEHDSNFLDIDDDLVSEWESDGPFDMGVMRITSEGLQWLCWGKHCGTEFWTGIVTLDEFKKGEWNA